MRGSHNVLCLKSQKSAFLNDAERSDKLNVYFILKSVDVQVPKAENFN